MNGRDELTVGPTATVIGTSEDSVRRMVDRGELPSRLTPGRHRLIPRWAAEAKKRELENAADPAGSGVTPNGDRPSTGTVERPERHNDSSGVDGDDGDLLAPDQAREEGRRYGLELIQRHGDARWLRERHRAWLYPNVGDLEGIVEDLSWLVPWPPLVQHEAFRRVSAGIERVVFHGIARGQVRRAVLDVVDDSWGRFQCPDPRCGGENRLACDAGCGCKLCEGF